MKIKKDDVVFVISGKDRGKKGKVIQVFSDKEKVVVEGANRAYRHMKPKKGGEKGERIEFNAPMPVSNVMLYCSKCSKPVKAGYKKQENHAKQDSAPRDKKVRICKKCKSVI